MVFKSKPLSTKSAFRVDKISARGNPEAMPKKNIVENFFIDFS
jgi:hypothetical protein